MSKPLSATARRKLLRVAVKAATDEEDAANAAAWRVLIRAENEAAKVYRKVAAAAAAKRKRAVAAAERRFGP